jgi:hypothetical protein
MASKSGILRIKVLGDDSNLSKTLDKSGGSLVSFAKKAIGAFAGFVIAKQVAGWLADAAKMAAEDAQQQGVLTKVVQNNTKATASQIKGLHDWVSAEQLRYGLSEERIRPALQKLIGTTKDVERAQKDHLLAMDVSRGMGLEYETVVNALVKAEAGQTAGLGRLGIAVRDAKGQVKDFDTISRDLMATYGGSAAEWADSAAGRYERLKIQIGETKESIGYALMPTVERFLPVAQRLAEWVGGLADDFAGASAGAGLFKGFTATARRAIDDFSRWFKGSGARVIGEGIVTVVKFGLTEALPALLDLAGDLLEGTVKGFKKAFFVDFADSQEMKRITEALKRQLEENTRNGIGGGIDRAVADITGGKTKTLIEYLYGGGREITSAKAQAAAEILRDEILKQQNYLGESLYNSGWLSTAFEGYKKSAEDAAEAVAELTEEQQAYADALAGIHAAKVSPASIWQEAEGSLKSYLKEMDKQLKSWTNFETNLKDLAKHFGPEFGADVIMKAAELGPEFVAKLVGSDPETVRQALRGLEASLGADMPGLAVAVAELSKPVGTAQGQAWSKAAGAALEAGWINIKSTTTKGATNAGKASGDAYVEGIKEAVNKKYGAFLESLWGGGYLANSKSYAKAAGHAAGDLGMSPEGYLAQLIGASPVYGKSYAGMGAQATGVWNALKMRFPEAGFAGGRANRPYTSDHTTGRAFDATGSTAYMRAMAQWLAANGHSLGIKYIIHNPLGIWYPRTGWLPYTPAKSVQAFAGKSAWHYDHVHVSTYEQGGSIPGTGPVPIIAHGGEEVVTKGDTQFVRDIISALNKGGESAEILAALLRIERAIERQPYKTASLRATGAVR